MVALMLLRERHERILGSLRSGGQTVHDLASALLVSESTIRRDLQALDRAGRLQRTYGGAVLTTGGRANITDSGAVEGSYRELAGREVPLREAMAREAAALVSDGDVVILDIGSTNAALARQLHGRMITVITSNLAAFDELRGDDTVQLVLLGGAVRRNYQSLVGPLTQVAVGLVNADIMFLSCTGVRGGRVMDDMAVEAPLKQSLIAAAERVVLLVSESKFPGTGAMRLCRLEDIDTLITTQGAPETELQYSRLAGRKVIVA